MGKAIDALRIAYGYAPKSLKSWQPPDYDPFFQPYWSTYGLRSNEETIGEDFDSYITSVYKSSGVVFACVTARMMAFSEARFQWRQFVKGRPGELFGSTELGLLENPWPGGTTGELLGRMEQDVSLAGNFYATVADDRGRIGRAAGTSGRRVVRMRPDWVTIVIGSNSDDPDALDARVVGYLYQPAPTVSRPRPDAVTLLPDEVCHYSPIPDPDAKFRGMSWLTPVLREVQADKAATTHKLRFFENGATPNMLVRFTESTTPQVFDEFVSRFNAAHQGSSNAYKTLFLGGGADVTVVGKDFQQLDFKATQGAGETRIAAAAGVPTVWVGFSEGLAGSSLNAGNFGQARRRFADATIRPLWRMGAASLQTLVTPPSSGASLWYDDRDVAFLREDIKDRADIRLADATTMETLVRAGYDQTSARDAVVANDMKLLIPTGLVSVQLQLPGLEPPAPAPASQNGSTNGHQEPVPA